MTQFSVGNALDGDRFNETAEIHLVVKRGTDWILSCTGGKAVRDESLVPLQQISCRACYTEAVRLIQEARALEEVEGAETPTD